MADNSLINQEQYNEDIKRFYDEKIYPYLNGATHTGCVPLGTILPYFGETAPTHFLICDGTEYAKSDYPELAEHLLALTDSTPYAGSDANHFKVPDLRGEFLRGSGTNSHTNQGNGANVGVHQDGTEIPVYAIQNGTLSIFGNNNYNYPRYPDGVKENATVRGAINTSTSSSSVEAVVNVRPTNTSVTYIIAYHNAYIDLALDSFPIDISNPTDGQLLMYDATAGRWVNGAGGLPTDVSNPTDGQLLQWSASSNNWINATVKTDLYYSTGAAVNIETYLGTLPSASSWMALVVNNDTTGTLVNTSSQHLFIIEQISFNSIQKIQRATSLNSISTYVRTYQWWTNTWTSWVKQ